MQLKKLANEKIKICDCPSEKDKPLNNLSKVDEEFQKIAKDLKNSEIALENSTHIMLRERNVVLKTAREEIKLVLVDILLECHYLLIKPVFKINANHFKQNNNFCINLKLDLNDLETKIWRTPIEIEDIKHKTIQCLEKCREKLNKHVNNSDSNEKKLVDGFVEILKNTEQNCTQHIKILEENSSKMLEIYKEMTKVRDEKCLCKIK